MERIPQWSGFLNGADSSMEPILQWSRFLDPNDLKFLHNKNVITINIIVNKTHKLGRSVIIKPLKYPAIFIFTVSINY